MVMTNKNIFSDIDKALDGYFSMSDSLLKKGVPWAVVVSFHEVYRYLYPTEPYINNYSVTDEEKPQFLLDIINKQINLYSSIEMAVSPYENMISGKLDNIFNDAKNLSTEDLTHTLYGNLWENFSIDDLIQEPKKLLEKRINTSSFNLNELKDKTILDIGCGSGRYTLALASYGCKNIIGYDMGDQGLKIGNSIIEKNKLNNITFKKGNVLDLPFEDNHFDFILCNGVLHHTKNMEKGLEELYRVLKPFGKAFLYLYASGGLFWNFRARARKIIARIPREYAQFILDMIGLPSNRFIFMDTWYVPIERHTTKHDLEKILKEDIGFKSIEKLVSKHNTDLESYINYQKPYYKELYGDGEHRYLLIKGNN